MAAFAAAAYFFMIFIASPSVVLSASRDTSRLDLFNDLVLATTRMIGEAAGLDPGRRGRNRWTGRTKGYGESVAGNR